MITTRQNKVSCIKAHDPFGMITFGRSWSVGSEYRYGLNGMENANEVLGNKNSIDFGARVYDSRLGRWFSTDPLQANQPNWSPYKAFMDNPILYVDYDGRVEYLVTAVVNAKTASTIYVIQVIDPDKMHSEWGHAPNKIDKSDTHKVMKYYDIVHHNTITIGEDGTIKKSVSADTYGHRYNRSYFKLARTLGNLFRTDITGEGDEQDFGYMFTSEDGGIDPTKYTAEHLKGVINIDDFMTTMEALVGAYGMVEWSKNPPNPKEIEDWVSGVVYTSGILKEFIKVNPEYADKVTPLLEATPSGKFVEVCTWCLLNRTGEEQYSTDHQTDLGKTPIPIEIYNKLINEE